MIIRKIGSWCSALAIIMVLTCVGSLETQAAGTPHIRGDWVDENLGPGAATWVDENGNEAEPSHMKHIQEQNEADTAQTGPGLTPGAPETSPQDQQPPATEESAVPQPEESGEAVPEEAAGRVIDPGRPMIALTFDDGPYAQVGNQIMDSLAQHGGKATFFVVGNRCPSYTAEMQRMAAEGHEIGNHTYDHKYLHKLSAEQIRYQIQKGKEVIEAISGVTCRLVRLPGGCKNDTVLANVDAPMIMWNIDTEDWKTKNAQKTVQAVVGKVKDGDIVLMHEIYKQSGAAAVEIIPALVNQGYQLVTVSELAVHRGGLENGKLYYKFRP